MSIICSICHKKQSGFFDDYPLSPKHKNMRICVTCQTMIQAIEDAGDDKDANEAIEYFDKFLSQGTIPEVADRITSAINKRAGIETEEDTQPPIEPEAVKNEYQEKSINFNLDDLYSNIGNKIKNWAKWIFVIEMIAAIIGTFVMLFSGDEELILPGILTLILGPIVAFVSTWILYGFGELIDKTSANEQHTAEILRFLYENNKK